ncbi:MAG: c-type cytochrome [Bacteroidota bacterium]|nr:c-type cytochrome [Bacteroidota bacterium]
MTSLFNSSQKIILLILFFFISVYLISNGSHPLMGCRADNKVAKQDSVLSWKYPDVTSITDNEEGKMIKLGRNIFVETYKYIGPDVKDSSMRFAGNNMDCQNCHWNAGTQQNVLGLVGVYSRYPEMDERLNRVISLKERINQCITRSMNGKPAPDNSKELNAIDAYLKWLSTYIPKGKTVEGNRLPKIPVLNRAADTAAGRIVFLNNCASCHALDGAGSLSNPGNIDVSADSLTGFDVPPVFGVQSYNDGAGMYRLLTAAAFIFSKMPLSSATLSIEKAYDVAAFVNSQSHPHKDGVEKDYPDIKFKPLDFSFPPFDDTFSQSQHKFGPFQPMLKEGEASKYVDPYMPLK